MLGKSNILRDNVLRKELGGKEEVTELGGDLAERVIPGGQVQKCFEKGEATGLQGSPRMSQVQRMSSIRSQGVLLWLMAVENKRRQTRNKRLDMRKEDFQGGRH